MGKIKTLQGPFKLHFDQFYIDLYTTKTFKFTDWLEVNPTFRFIEIAFMSLGALRVNGKIKEVLSNNLSIISVYFLVALSLEEYK